MSFSSYDPHTRYRKRAFYRFLNMGLAMAVLFGVGMLGYWVGQQSSIQRIASLNQSFEDVQAQKSEVEAVLMELRTEAQTATLRYEQLQDNVEQQVPEGPMQGLVDLVRKQLEEGMDPERLSFLIRSARPPRNCSVPESRRFVISTPAYKGAESSVLINEQAELVVKGRGQSVNDKDGKPEAWYDPAKRVSISFQVGGGAEKIKSGVLPLRHSVVVGDREYRMSIEEAETRSFAKVTYDSCDYP